MNKNKRNHEEGAASSILEDYVKRISKELQEAKFWIKIRTLSLPNR